MIERERLVNTFCELVRIDSPSGEEEAVAQYLTQKLTALGLRVERDSHGNVIASEDGDNPLILSAHMDTVEPGRGIKPRIEEDRIVSDGTTILGGDCKAGVAAILEGLQSIKDEGAKRRPVQAVFTRGEEIGLVGAQYLDYGILKGEEAVVFDGNGPVGTITASSPTYISFDVKVKGRAAHAGVEPEKGLSAIRIASDIISQLPQGRLDEETTINVGTISGGSVRNAVPEDVTFSGEFRSRNTETLELTRLQVLQVLQAAREKYQDASIDEELDVRFRMYHIDPDGRMVSMVSNVLQDLSLTANISPSGGGTDGNVFLERGIDALVVGMSTNEMHTIREYVKLDELHDTARFCHGLLVAGF